MSNIKKIIAVVLALVLALSVASIAFAYEDSTVTSDKFTIAVTADKTTLNPGESANVTVKVTANYYVIAMTIPVYFDNTKLTVSNASTTLAKGNVILPEDASDDYYQNTSYTRDDHGVVVFQYIPKVNQTQLSQYNNETVMTFTVTAKEGASGDVEVGCLNDVKTFDNSNGTIIVGKCATGDKFDSANSQPQTVTNYDISGAKTTITIAGAAAAADLALTAGATAGIVIDTNKTFGGQYDGVVYGFTLTDSTAQIKATTMYTANLQASNGGSLQFTPIKVGRTNCYGTGASIKVLNQDGTLSKTYVIVIFGDVNSDGAITGLDTGIVYAHQKGDMAIANDVLIMAANTAVEGRTVAAKQASMYTITGTDTGIVYAHQKGEKLIDQQSAATLQNSYNANYQ